MRTSNDWLKEIEELYEGQKNGSIKAPQAVEMNNTIGKLIHLTKLQLEYNKLRRQLDDKASQIPMLESGIAAAPTP